MARVWSSIRRACGGLASPGPESHSLVVDAPPPSRRQSPRAPPRPSDPNPRRESRSSDRYACVSHATANETPPCRRPGRPRIAPVRLAGPRDLRWHPEAGASGLLRGAVALRPEAGASLRRLDTLAARPRRAWRTSKDTRSLVHAMQASSDVAPSDDRIAGRLSAGTRATPLCARMLRRRLGRWPMPPASGCHRDPRHRHSPHVTTIWPFMNVCRRHS